MVPYQIVLRGMRIAIVIVVIAFQLEQQNVTRLSFIDIWYSGVQVLAGISSNIVTGTPLRDSASVLTHLSVISMYG